MKIHRPNCMQATQQLHQACMYAITAACRGRNGYREWISSLHFKHVSDVAMTKEPSETEGQAKQAFQWTRTVSSLPSINAVVSSSPWRSGGHQAKLLTALDFSFTYCPLFYLETGGEKAPAALNHKLITSAKINFLHINCRSILHNFSFFQKPKGKFCEGAFSLPRPFNEHSVGLV